MVICRHPRSRKDRTKSASWRRRARARGARCGGRPHASILAALGPMPSSRTFSSMSRRVSAARAELELSGVDDDELVGGLAALSKRKKLKKAEDLAARARHELNKARYALPCLSSPARCSRLARCGFDHSQLIVETLRNSVKGADEELAMKCFREAVKCKKLDDSIVLDQHAVTLIKQHLGRARP
jgi:hypothetical protein